MRVLSLNVGIWTRNWKRSDTNYWLKRARVMSRVVESLNVDVICFQEMWFPMSMFVPKGYRKVRGTGWEHPIYVRDGIGDVHKSSFHITWSSAVVNSVEVVNVHTRWESRILKRTCEGIVNHCDESPYLSLLCGDFNNSWGAVKGYLPKSFESVREVLDEPMKDTFEHFTKPKSHGEIDLFVTDGVLVPLYYDVYLSSDGGIRFSDHCPVVVEV